MKWLLYLCAGFFGLVYLFGNSAVGFVIYALYIAGIVAVWKLMKEPERRGAEPLCDQYPDERY